MKKFSLKDVAEILESEWKLQGAIKKLAGFEDQNFYLKDIKGTEWLIKISSADNSDLMLAQHGLYKQCGKEVRHIETEQYHFRLIPWTPGRPWANLTYKSPELYHDFGVKMADHLQLIRDYDHPALQRGEFEWDLANALWIKNHLSELENEIKQIVVDLIEDYKSNLPTYDALPKCTIHNDLNDYNILVEQQQITGFIDYGDACYSQRINEVAIALAYVIMGQEDPLDSACQVIKGFTSKATLAYSEIEMLHTLVGMRLAVSLVTSAINIKEQPENKYLQVSREPALALIRELHALGRKWTTYKLLHAAGHDLKFATAKISQSETAMVVPMKADDYITLDLSVGSKELGHEKDYNDANHHHAQIQQLLRQAGKTFAIGSYNEVRPLYSSDDFTELGNEGQRWRTVHIGIDFFAEAGTEVYAFADGEVHALKYNEGDKNYGNTVILKHEGFFTLYGHLSTATLEHLTIGQQVKRGDLIAWFGEPHENGNWAPHLHFQIVMDMLNYQDDFPGVCHIHEREIWTQLSPDPRPYLDIKVDYKHTHSAEYIRERRRKRLGRSYSLSYDEPLHMVRAHGPFLYDETGRKYLDCVNNVAHVGHQNINVVKAQINQAQLLNTNTRYLHSGIVELADKLTSTLAEHLSVCHFVNSGSEANELAIRMARAYTGRNDVLAMDHGYHGNTNLCVDISAYKFNGKGGMGQKDWVQIVPLDGSWKSFDEDRELPAAFIHESILSCAGQVVMPPHFFEEIYQHCDGNGVVKIADEVQTGLGRIGSHMWAFQAEGVSPDIVTIGKPFGNGHPLAAVVCTPEIADAFANGMEFFNTFGGNTVSCAVGLAVLQEIEDLGLQKHAFDLGQWLLGQLSAIKEKYPIISDVRGRGFFLGWEFIDRNSGKPLDELAHAFVQQMKRFGILLSTDGPHHNVIKFKPPMVFSKENADYLLEMMELTLSILID